ncbi:Uncharacterized protein TCM_006589 [Theobroma cacao]|uniref:Uncharacterized protein n=1 Tax=Theobroma cacao TaxID=3641 RepID=A0A061DZW5_THECC|nr:Uncharacterized protein TCM_006589 [Theobroma cacao]
MDGYRNISMQYFTVRPLGRRFLSHGWSLKAKGCETLEDKKVTDIIFNEETGCITNIFLFSFFWSNCFHRKQLILCIEYTRFPSQIQAMLVLDLMIYSLT